eukprot:TRINITY_DN76353_c0_g1_i1.p1 TRINITY_DN76353_c0_g1~~TRINITY_DN76353_c0_g1_i1.p1  ORF type:complete len:234 (+),score=53.54 TRINITY_DN76353_c0_g1_i1:40-741(+)
MPLRACKALAAGEAVNGAKRQYSRQTQGQRHLRRYRWSSSILLAFAAALAASFGSSTIRCSAAFVEIRTGRRWAVLATAQSLAWFGRPALASEKDDLAVIRAARDTIAECLGKYSDLKSSRVPDDVRRYLGTVGSGSPLYPGPGKSGKLATAYKSLAAASGDTEILELADELTRHLAEADNIVYSANFVDDSGMQGSIKCKGGSCVPVYFDDAEVELKLALKGFDALLKAVGT